MIDLIYTSGNNRELAQITTEEQWMVGMRSDKHPYMPISFMDIRYKQPNFERHLAMIKEHQPKYAVVPDLSDDYSEKQDVLRALHQAEQITAIAPHTTVLIVPKRSAQLQWIPSDFSLGYSIPTSNGGAKFGLWKLSGRRVHLLGGNPHYQMKLYRLHRHNVHIHSADGNMAQKAAFEFSKFWTNNRWIKHPEATQNKDEQKPDLPYECIRMSLQNIKQAWIRLYQPTSVELLWNCEVA